jgi:hypothetical protein
MLTKHICKKCLYNTSSLKDIIRHINKKNKCSKNIDAYDYSDDQLLILSIFPYYNNIHSITDYEIEQLSKSTILYDNLDMVINLIKDIDKSKIKKCKYCNEEFTKIIDLRKHIIINCFYKELKKEDSTGNSNIKINNGNEIINNYNNNIDILNNINEIQNNNNKNLYNINNQCTTNNNITNIFLDLKNPIPFDEDWDISKIDESIKGNIIFNNLMYTGLLEEILKNEINLNVIIDKKNKSGIVYKNDIEQYIEMKSKDIIIDTMAKLRKQLLEINNSTKHLFLKECVDYSRRIINKKYIDYEKDKKLQDLVTECIENTFDKKKEEAICISKKIKNKNKNKGIYGF